MSSLSQNTATYSLSALRHHLRTPLNHIAGYAEMLLENAIADKDTSAIGALQEVVQSVPRICDIIQNHPTVSEHLISSAEIRSLQETLHPHLAPLRLKLQTLYPAHEAGLDSQLQRIVNAVNELQNFSTAKCLPPELSDPESFAIAHALTAPISGHVLIVDDDDANRDLLKLHLERQDLWIEEASSGQDALRRLRSDAFDVVLLDLLMPGINGLDVLSEIRSDPKLRGIPVLVISASDEMESVAESIRRGAEDYLTKPFEPTMLRARLAVTLERKHLRDQELRRSAELESVTQALQRSNEDLRHFAYAASHDLQTPLRTIITYLELLERRLGPRLTSDEGEMVHFARDAGRRMSTLIQDLLLLSQVNTSGRRYEPIAMETLVGEIVHDARSLIEETGAIISCGVLPTINSDRTRVRQILQNLISNAIKYRGAVAPVVCISAEQHADNWQFSVSDNGIGIPPEYREKIFLVFQRLHGYEVPGSGLGLAICQRIVDSLGGRIWVESTVGEGSTFSFTLPAHY